MLLGTVEVTTGHDNNNVSVTRLGSGDFFGEIAILLDVPRTANVRSITPLKVLVLSRTDFLGACNTYPHLAAHFKNMADEAYQAQRMQVNYHFVANFIHISLIPVCCCKDDVGIINTPRDTITGGRKIDRFCHAFISLMQ